MNRKLNWAAIATFGLMVTGCVGQYTPPAGNSNPGSGSNPTPADPVAQDPQDPTQPTDPGEPLNPQPPSPAAPTTPSTAKPLFEQKVQPILAAAGTGCAGAACHSPPGTSPIRFMTTAETDQYAAILGFADKLLAGNFDKTKAQLITKVTPGHYTAKYTAQNITDINEWLDAEIAARAAGGGDVAVVSERAKLLAEWSGCMNLAEWNQAGVAAAWANKGTNQGNCQQCHVNAQGWLASAESERVFNILTTQKNPKTQGMFMEYYFTVDASDPANLKMVINRDMLVRAAQGAAQHPTFNVDGNPYTRLQNFYNQTLARQAAKTCDPPRFTP